MMAEFAFVFCCGFFLFVLFLLAAFYAFSIYNGLISLRNNIDKAWANIDVLLKQRSDLIPNLVEAVKGYMKHEKAVLTEITQLRTALMGATTPSAKAKTSEGISAALKTIFAVAENYPKLEASQNFLELQKQLTAMENQIADRREFYNDSVLLFNTRIHSLPDLVFASMMGLKDKEYFKAAEEEKKAVEVKMEERPPVEAKAEGKK
jgi:LemA protein